jgi:hypothetical protein
MILAGESRRIQTETCPGDTLHSTNPIWIGPVLNPAFHDDGKEGLVLNIFLMDYRENMGYIIQVLSYFVRTVVGKCV